jgi:ubiquinone/menaquinone biosynthesis C-methylase UbiE
MTIQALRDFINRTNPAAAGLAALGAALDARASGTPLDPALAARVDELLAALGGGDVLDGVSAPEATPFLADVRTQLGFNAKLLYAQKRATCWNYDDRQLLQEIGDFARSHAHGLTRNVVPALEGLSARFSTPGAAFLDIGVGVAGLAIELAQLWPQLRIVGIDVWQPSLALARDNVERAGLRDRIELREQGAEKLDDDQAFDLTWMPILFMPERVIPAAIERNLRALRPGGWGIFCFANFDGKEPQTAAFWRLRTTTWGGPLWIPSQVETLLRDHGFADVRTLPSPPGVHVVCVVGRRKQE